MRTTAFRAVATAACIVLLAGCSIEHPPPSGPSDAEVAAAVQERLDHQWAISGLEGVIPRPAVPVERVVSMNEWGSELGDCLAEADIHSWGYGSIEGLHLYGGRASVDEQLALYSCFAQYPTLDLLSVAQLDYIYDYFMRWLIPCLEFRGFRLTAVPTREQFTTVATNGIGNWNPYHSLAQFPSLERQTALLKECPPTVPGIEGWSE